MVIERKHNGKRNVLYVFCNCSKCTTKCETTKSNYDKTTKKHGVYRCKKCALEKRNSERTHYKGTPIHNSYAAAKQRCNDKNFKQYHNYGGRGIKFMWKSFNDFLTDMGDSWFIGATIDRIDVNGNYEKSNCQWITLAENAKKDKK